MALLGIANFLVLVLFLVSCDLKFLTCTETITPTQFVRDPEAVTSEGGVFKLGFFSPPGSADRYVAIWYNQISVVSVIWVANRDRPLKDSSGTVKISEDGNIVVSDGQNEVLWSSNVSGIVTANVTTRAQLFDSGNLVLQEIDSSNNRTVSIWESFGDPTDSFLPSMEITNGEGKQALSSWKSSSNPSVGNFSAGLDSQNIPEVLIWKMGSPYWRSGPWTGLVFIGIPDSSSVYLKRLTLVDEKETPIYLTYTVVNQSFLSNFALNPEGNFVLKYWDDLKQNWDISWSALNSECDVYGTCGSFGSCNPKSSPICSCLRGFKPKNIEEWSAGNWTSGCVRRTPTQCERTNSSLEIGKPDGFFRLENVKVPDFAEWSSGNNCEALCLANCSCIAYAYFDAITCMIWTVNLIDIQKFSEGGTDIYIRVADSELNYNRKKKVIILAMVITGAAAASVFTFFLCRWMAKRKASKELLLSRGKKSNRVYSGGNMQVHEIKNINLQNLPLSTFDMLVTATDNFDSSNLLGQGGFGPVYKGKMPNGQEIAVKRLSRASRQGLQEFMNEVGVISKLQHRNLVRLLGCCIEGDEKILIYEYLPNKSLDAILFDPLICHELDWRKRQSIITEIARGILYLHRDSRLRIIHRDLKASNILLDEELNPKISDFGLARIFGGNQDQAKTRKVVGTFGYMSPEYAIHGRYSEKSDVYSFGVLLLEILSGRRSTSFHPDDQTLSLLGFAWKSWTEENTAAFVSPVIYAPSDEIAILRFLHVGLLCVQEHMRDRPSMSTVISMLNSEILDLPSPKAPAFTSTQADVKTQQDQKHCSVNNLTVTIVKPR
ncbi:G-type lectin S-receptor-like serine/threonine-protein kinase At1g11330 [Rhodamnia argentea]|uniref:Receptor-like serine/threonine-protein kinase n=1 Tax=Rhodamnia argentea TaxID=178133 RepID=A0A8B8P1L5_9MYRT|nr:G-type lectin S-receptor-like serine/threonine-protein kinase At1g11330 [Rhodamnia argentea]